MANFLSNFLFIWALFMVIIGSMVPDVDASDSIFFHDYPYLSQFFKYFIYYPVAYVHGKRKHRGIMHTLPGLIITTTLFLGYIIGISLIVGVALFLLSPNILETIIDTIEGIEDVSFDILYIGMFFLVTIPAFMFGMFAHLWEDSTTVSGIRWFSNKQYVSRGSLKVGGTNENLAFIVFTGAGLIVVLIELAYADDIPILQLILPIASFLIFLGLGVIFRHPMFKNLFGKDFLLKDIQTREKAERNSIDIAMRGFTYRMERDRIKRGLTLANEFKTLNKFNKRVGQTIVDQGGGSLACSCNDFKICHDLTLCKHLIAYLYLSCPDDQKALEEHS